jgi:hypothetical protein
LWIADSNISPPEIVEDVMGLHVPIDEAIRNAYKILDGKRERKVQRWKH